MKKISTSKLLLSFPALHRCVRDNNAQACHILLTHNVDTSIVSHQGFTAMALASDNIKSILQGTLNTCFVTCAKRLLSVSRMYHNYLL